MQVPDIDIKNVLNNSLISQAEEDHPEFSSFDFCPRDLDEGTSLHLSIKMFRDLNFLAEFQIPEDKLARFLLLVQRGYRKVNSG
jgi:cGMP-dependent 3',5'-cyclic phosphodiesterase